MKETLLTKEGYKELEKELEYLKSVKRPEVSDKIRVARGFGDLSENAEYDAAKEEQAQVEARILQIEDQIKTSTIIEDSGEANSVKVGSTVKLLDMEYNEEMTYKLVGTVEANPRKGRISNESPLGQAIIGAKKGDVLDVKTPAGVIQYKVLDIVKEDKIGSR